MWGTAGYALKRGCNPNGTAKRLQLTGDLYPASGAGNALAADGLSGGVAAERLVAANGVTPSLLRRGAQFSDTSSLDTGDGALVQARALAGEWMRRRGVPPMDRHDNLFNVSVRNPSGSAGSRSSWRPWLPLETWTVALAVAPATVTRLDTGVDESPPTLSDKRTTMSQL